MSKEEKNSKAITTTGGGAFPTTLIVHVIGELIVIGGVFFILNRKINALDQRVVTLEQALKDQDSGELLKRVVIIENELVKIDNAFESIENKFDNQDVSLDEMKQQITYLTSKVASLEKSRMQPPFRSGGGSGGGGGGGGGGGEHAPPPPSNTGSKSDKSEKQKEELEAFNLSNMNSGNSQQLPTIIPPEKGEPPSKGVEEAIKASVKKMKKITVPIAFSDVPPAGKGDLEKKS